MFNNYNPYPAPQYNYAMSPYTNLIYVSGIEDARARMVPNGSTMIFADNDKPLLYKKTVDNKGQYTVDVYDITPHKEELTKPTGFVSKPEFEALQHKLDDLEKTIAPLITTKKEVAPNGTTSINGQN